MTVRRLLAGRRRTKSISRGKVFGCSRVIAYNLVRRSEQTEISMDAQYRRDVRKQHLDKAVYLHSYICVSSSSPQL